MTTQPNPDYNLAGQITDQRGTPLEGLIVRAYDQDPLTPADPLRDEALTDAEGRYEIGIMEGDFRVGGLETGGPDVFIRAYDDDELLGESPVKHNAGRRITIDLQVDYIKVDPTDPTRRVYGVVRDARGDPLTGVTVEAFDRDLRSEQSLGKSQTNRRGHYEIQYHVRQSSERERGNDDLVVKAFAEEGSLLATSSVLYNAPPDAQLDLSVPAEVLQPPTLFERIDRALPPLLPVGLKVEELEEDQRHQDLSFLSGETGFEKETLARFVIAHKLAEQAIRAEFWFALLGGSFCEYTEEQSLTEQLEAVLDALPSLDAAAAYKSLVRAFNEREIPGAFQENVSEWVEAFLEFAAAQTVRGSSGPTFVGLALEDAGISDAEKQETFARLFNEHKALTPDLIETLEEDPSFEEPEIADLRTSFELADLTRGDFSVVRMVKEEFGVRQPEQIRPLAKRSEDEWVDLVVARHAAGDIDLPIGVGEVTDQVKLPDAEVYGRMLERQFREAFPTTAFAGALDRALHNGGTHGLRKAEELATFLDRHEDFELLTTRVDGYIEDHLNPDSGALEEDEDFRLEVKAIQRVFKLTPTFEATDALLADDLHSAQKVYRLGESEFVRRYADRPGFTTETARLAWNRAADTHAAVLTIVADLKALDAEALPQVLQNDSEALATFPNWNNLFATGDLCECEHCRSVLGPAAYFADLLMFLKDREAADPTQSVKDMLFRRRPDLGFLELNCDNALTTLPYIDVVCEVLEDVVAAGENDLELPGFTTMPADPDDAKDAVAAAFDAQSISLGADFSLSQVDPSIPTAGLRTATT